MVNLANLPVSHIPNQFVLIHLPHIMHMDRHVAERLSLSDKIRISVKLAVFRRNLRWAKGFWVQTEAAQADLQRIYGLDSSIMQNAVDAKIEDVSLQKEQGDGYSRLLTLSHYFPHKNLEIIGEVATRIQAKGLPYKFVVTLDPTASAETARFLRSIQWAIDAGIVENRGVVATEQLPALFAKSDALFLPTLLESFSTTYVEAMRFGLPILTSDRGFARSVCQSAARYFDPLSVDEAEAAITSLASSPAVVQSLIVAGRQRLSTFPNWPDVTDAMLLDIRARTEAGKRQV